MESTELNNCIHQVLVFIGNISDIICYTVLKLHFNRVASRNLGYHPLSGWPNAPCRRLHSNLCNASQESEAFDDAVVAPVSSVSPEIHWQAT